MEDRNSPTDVFWTNASGDTLISNKLNWNPNEIPDSFDVMFYPQAVSGVVTVNQGFGTNGMELLGKDYTFNNPIGQTHSIGLTDGGLLANYAANGTSTLNVPLDFFFANNPTITVRNDDSKLVFGGPIAVFTAPDESLTFDGAGDTVLNGRINSGFAGDPADVIKQGTGTLTFSMGTGNAYNSTTTVRDGKLVLNSPAATVVPRGLVIGDGIGAEGSAIVEQMRSNQLDDATTTVSLQSDGLWDLSVGAGSEKLAGLQSGSSTAQVKLGTASLNLNPITPANYAGFLTSTGGSITVNLGDQTFSGPMTFDGGGVTVTNGAKLEIQNSVGGTSGTISTANNGMDEELYHSGSAVSVSVFGTDQYFAAIRDSSGALSPANPLVGTLNLAATSKNYFQIDSAGSFSGITVTSGVSSLGNLNVKLGTIYVPQSAESFTILDNQTANPVGTTFNGLGQGATFMDADGKTEFRIDYFGGDGNDIVITNTNPQTVTINQASVQSDPTSGTTATFDAVFSGNVKAFDPSKISLTLGGTLTSTGTSVFQRSPTIYRIVVNGLSGTGTLSMSLLAGAGTSFANVPSLPSTSTDNSVTRVAPPTPSTPSGGTTSGGNGNPSNSSAVLPGTGIATLVGAGAGNRANVYRGGETGSTQVQVSGAEFAGGVRTASADFNRDGFEDFVFGSGPGGSSFVRILDGRNGQTLFNGSPFEQAFTGGVFVATGDFDTDGVPDLVVTPDVGGGPRVLVYSGKNFQVVADFLGIDDAGFRGGARPTAGDINRDGVDDLVIAAGFGGGPRIAGYNGTTIFGATAQNPPVKLFADFFAFEPTLTNGVFVAIGDIDGDGFGDVIAGGGPGGGPRVTGFSGSALLSGARVPIANFFAGEESNRGGIRLAVEDFDADGTLDLIAGAGENGGSRVTVYPLSTLGGTLTPPILSQFDAFPDSIAGVYVG